MPWKYMAYKPNVGFVVTLSFITWNVMQRVCVLQDCCTTIRGNSGNWDPLSTLLTQRTLHCLRVPTSLCASCYLPFTIWLFLSCFRIEKASYFKIYMKSGLLRRKCWCIMLFNNHVQEKLFAFVLVFWRNALWGALNLRELEHCKWIRNMIYSMTQKKM